MCGFFATNDNSLALSKKTLDETIGFRGPDYRSDVVSYKGWRVYHARLSIISIDETANQPIIDDHGLVLFNGEIFNYKALAEKYDISANYSDTLVLSELLSIPGFSVHELDGFFSIVRIDEQGALTHCVRDKFGVKPLFYHETQSSLSIASEPNILVELYNLEVNQNAIIDYKIFRAPVVEASYYTGLSLVAPGTCKISGAYFNLLDLFLDAKDIEAPEKNELMKTLQVAVRSRQISDVSFSVLFSGGIDSNLIRLCLSERPDFLFCGSMQEQNYDSLAVKELEDSRAIENLKLVTLNNNEYLEYLKKMVMLRKEPLSVPNEIILYKIGLVAKSLGQKVLLSGEAADEFFAGYDRIFRFFNENEFCVEKFLQMYCYNSKLIDRRVEDYFENYFDALDGLTAFEKVRYFFIEKHLPILFRRLDFALMAAGIEGREPLATIAVLQKALCFSGRDLVNNQIGKLPLRSIVADFMGDDFAYRSKVGFPVDLKHVTDYRLSGDNYEVWTQLNLEVLQW